MIYVFKSKATGTVVMTQPVAEKLLSIIGKSPGPQGIITVEQMPAAIAALEQAVAQEKAAGRDPAGTDGVEEANEIDRSDDHRSVSLAQRAFPLLEMLREAHRADREITWGI
ncbi:MAG TPA: DUF1840 domain-containing protein [Burkholderiaceae bacterium]|nr:DUF1840 domain-containing protein [Burkholderiaceae bacterium]